MTDCTDSQKKNYSLTADYTDKTFFICEISFVSGVSTEAIGVILSIDY